MNEQIKGYENHAKKRIIPRDMIDKRREYPSNIIITPVEIHAKKKIENNILQNIESRR